MICNKRIVVIMATTAILTTLCLIGLRSDFRLQTTFTFGINIEPRKIRVEIVPKEILKTGFALPEGA